MISCFMSGLQRVDFPGWERRQPEPGPDGVWRHKGDVGIQGDVKRHVRGGHGHSAADLHVGQGRRQTALWVVLAQVWLVTARRRSCGKVMFFTRVCHSVQRRGLLPTGVVPSRGLPIGGVCLHGGRWCWEDPPSWNAFLFHIHLSVHTGSGAEGR